MVCCSPPPPEARSWSLSSPETFPSCPSGQRPILSRQVADHLYQDQISDRKRSSAELAIEAFHLRGADPMEEADLYRGIDDDHDRSRSSRSPTQRSLQRKERISPCGAAPGFAAKKPPPRASQGHQAVQETDEGLANRDPANTQWQRDFFISEQGG